MPYSNKIEDAISYIEGQLRNGYIDLGFHDEIELDIVREAIKLYRSKYELGGDYDE